MSYSKFLKSLKYLSNYTDEELNRLATLIQNSCLNQNRYPTNNKDEILTTLFKIVRALYGYKQRGFINLETLKNNPVLNSVTPSTKIDVNLLNIFIEYQKQLKPKNRIPKTQRKQQFTTTKKIIGTKKQNPEKTIKKNKKICNNIEEIVKLIRSKLDPNTYPTDTHVNTRKTIQKITKDLYRWEKNGNKSLGIKPHCIELIGVTNSVSSFSVELLNSYIYFKQPSEDRKLDLDLKLENLSRKQRKLGLKIKELEKKLSSSKTHLTRHQYEKHMNCFNPDGALTKLGKRKFDKLQGDIDSSSNLDNPKKRLKLNDFSNNIPNHPTQNNSTIYAKNLPKYMKQNHSFFNQYHHTLNNFTMHTQHPYKYIQQNHGFFNKYQYPHPYQYYPIQNNFIMHTQHPYKHIQQNHGFFNQHSPQSRYI